MLLLLLLLRSTSFCTETPRDWSCSNASADSNTLFKVSVGSTEVGVELGVVVVATVVVPLEEVTSAAVVVSVASTSNGGPNRSAACSRYALPYVRMGNSFE